LRKWGKGSNINGGKDPVGKAKDKTIKSIQNAKK